MGAGSEGSASRAGLALLGVLSAAGFLPVLMSAPTALGGPRPAVSVHETAAAPAPPASVHRPPTTDHVAVVVIDAPAPPAPEPTPEPASDVMTPAPPPAASVETPAPAPADPPPPPADELVALAPESPSSSLAGLGGALTPADVPVPVPVVPLVNEIVATPVPVVDGVVRPLLGSLLSG